MKQFITNILEAKRNSDGTFMPLDAGTLGNSEVVAKGDANTGIATLVLGKGASGLKGQYYAANYDTLNNRYTGQLASIAPFQITGEPDFDPTVKTTEDGIEVTNSSATESNGSSAADSSQSSSSNSSSSSK